MGRTSYNPMWDDIWGVIKTFLIIWVIWIAIIFVIGGCSYLSFMGGIGLGFFAAIITTALLGLRAGVKNQGSG